MSYDSSKLQSATGPWLLPKLDGVGCRSHNAILASMVGYNIVAILLFLTLNSPTLYPRIKSIQGTSWQMLRRAVTKSPKGTINSSIVSSTTAPVTQEQEADAKSLRRNTYQEFLLLLLGHMFITTAAPLIAAILITRQYPEKGPSIWGQISHWATRPRTTAPMIFLYVCIQVLYHPDLKQQANETTEAFAERKRIYDDSHPGARKVSPYGTAIVVACFGDQVVSALGLDNVNRMIIYAGAEYPADERRVLVRSLQMLRVGIGFGFAANLGIMWFLGRFIQLSVLEHRRGLEEPQPKCWGGEMWVLVLTMCLFAAHLFLGFLGGWMVWKAFLELETQENYCVQRLWQVDLVYYLLPVVLNLWRIMAKRAGRQKRAENGEDV